MTYSKSKQNYTKNEALRRPGIEPGSLAWEANMIPLHQRRHFDVRLIDTEGNVQIKVMVDKYTIESRCHIEKKTDSKFARME